MCRDKVQGTYCQETEKLAQAGLLILILGAFFTTFRITTADFPFFPVISRFLNILLLTVNRYQVPGML